MTSRAQREKASGIANEIAGLQGVQSAVVDDDNGYGSFNLFVKLRNRLEEHYASRRIEFVIPLCTASWPELQASSSGMAPDWNGTNLRDACIQGRGMARSFLTVTVLIVTSSASRFHSPIARTKDLRRHNWHNWPSHNASR